MPHFCLSIVSRSRNKKRLQPISAHFTCFKHARLFLRGGLLWPCEGRGDTKGASPPFLWLGLACLGARLHVRLQECVCT
jgi:hypothetical protein